MRVRDGWDKADRLHEAFAQSITQILTYRNFGNEQTVAEQQWGEDSQQTAADCRELIELLRIAMRVTKGIRLGWMTLTHERDSLQRQPADTLSDAWPKLVVADAENAMPVITQDTSDDMLVRIAAQAVNATLGSLEVQPTVFYNFLYSLASAANTSFTCPYEAVQTCSAWRVRLWQGLIIVVFYFSIATLLMNAAGLSFISALLVPFFSVALLQLCYGYTFTCLPMVPVCAWQDFTESVNVLFPLTLELPDDLKKTDAVCIQRCTNSSSPCLPRYPSANCTKSCKDTPFSYTSASSVITWVIAEMGSGATDYALNNSHYVPLLQHQRFDSDLRSHISTLRRGSSDFIHAHRLCASLSSYMLFPYIVLLLLALGFVSTMLTLLSTQIFPVLLLVFSLFTAASAGPNHTVYSAEVTKKAKDQNINTTEENTAQMQADIGLQNVLVLA
jgi:hypothetical protein